MPSCPASYMFTWVTVGLLGLITGSFLNAVIHRLPLGISLLQPRRSFCPGCGRTIPWHENLPVASWVLLRGRCSGCAMPIAVRYPLVEILGAGLYLLAWGRFGLPLAPVYWLFLSLLVAATFIDFDHLIIPDEITLGGTAAGLLCSAALPGLMEAGHWWEGLLLSAAGAATGYFLLWGVVELGKVAFGRRTITPEEALEVEVTGSGSDLLLRIGGEDVPMTEFFYRESDRVEATVEWLEIDGERHAGGTLTIGWDSLCLKGPEGAPDRQWAIGTLEEAMPVRARATRLILPREAMGFGDVKFLACIGAFLGWKGVLFAVFAGSVIGALIGTITLLSTRGRHGGRIPFGPYLALGASLWLLAGPELLDLYAECTRRAAGAFFLLQHGPRV